MRSDGITDEGAAVELKVKTWIPCIDTFMDGGVEHVNAYMREHEAGEHVLLRDFVALRAENTELSARVSELTRQLGDSDHSITNLLREREQNLTRIIELTRLLAEAERRASRIEDRVADLNRYGGAGPGFGGICQRHDGRYVLLEDVLAVVRALQSGEGGG